MISFPPLCDERIYFGNMLSGIGYALFTSLALSLLLALPAAGCTMSTAAEQPETEANSPVPNERSCQPGPDPDDCPESCPESCDGIDNDCDGLTDEDKADQECNLPHAVAVCAEGVCWFQTCEYLYGDCDGYVENGCETVLTTSDNCGACGKACERDHASAYCDHVGQCRFESCDAGWGNCDGDVYNGCETSLNTVDYCGRCNRSCKSLPQVATARCEEGACVVEQCEEGYQECDADPTNGCESVSTGGGCS